MDAGDRTDQTDEGVSVLEAAATLGLSEKTVYRRIKAGKLRATKRRTTTGYEWRVHLSEPAEPPDTPPASRDQETSIVRTAGPSGRGGQELSRLWDRHERVTLAYGRLKADYEQLARENDDLRALLGAPQPPARIPWWRRIFARKTP